MCLIIEKFAVSVPDSYFKNFFTFKIKENNEKWKIQYFIKIYQITNFSSDYTHNIEKYWTAS